MAMSTEQKQKVEEFLKRKAGTGGRSPCELCGSVGALVVQDDPVGPPVWQPATETATEGIDPNRTFPFVVACCPECNEAHFFPWGLIFSFSPPAPREGN